MEQTHDWFPLEGRIETSCEAASRTVLKESIDHRIRMLQEYLEIGSGSFWFDVEHRGVPNLNPEEVLVIFNPDRFCNPVKDRGGQKGTSLPGWSGMQVLNKKLLLW